MMQNFVPLDNRELFIDVIVHDLGKGPGLGFHLPGFSVQAIGLVLQEGQQGVQMGHMGGGGGGGGGA